MLLDFGADELNKQIPHFYSTLKSWRKKVVDELDNLGIKYNSGLVDYSYYFSKTKQYVPTKVLSENFQIIPRKLNYYWLNQNQRQIELAIDEFSKLLRQTYRGNPKKEEKLYHQFFNENDFFLLRDNYSKSWYELTLPYGKNKSYQPDYSLKPNMNYKTDLNILEVKLPNEGFVKNTKFHPNLYSKFFEHLGQINDYKMYLENEEFRNIIQQRYGWYPERVQYSLLMGREAEKEENLDTLTVRMKQFGQENIYLMTYDELLAYQVRFLDRMNLLQIN
ncbi:Shedu anti-phage system protein SduA domain-containing protein [Mucilaginibacter corticis]|uniref:Shedu anti-phage system protein SduA domain-containing protein n=1 Tax=Mucilaginibacter corticis TaxID=2597670 RepID=UPI001642996E|nr:Shedu anti-phage system protein SduA domain-containing protein [Mucilaginibacter corticis]